MPTHTSRPSFLARGDLRNSTSISNSASSHPNRRRRASCDLGQGLESWSGLHRRNSIRILQEEACIRELQHAAATSDSSIDASDVSSSSRSSRRSGSRKGLSSLSASFGATSITDSVRRKARKQAMNGSSSKRSLGVRPPAGGDGLFRN